MNDNTVFRRYYRLKHFQPERYEKLKNIVWAILPLLYLRIMIKPFKRLLKLNLNLKLNQMIYDASSSFNFQQVNTRSNYINSVSIKIKIMSPNKRSSSPTQRNSLSEPLRQDFYGPESALHEIHSITMFLHQQVALRRE